MAQSTYSSSLPLLPYPASSPRPTSPDGGFRAYADDQDDAGPSATSRYRPPLHYASRSSSPLANFCYESLDLVRSSAWFGLAAVGVVFLLGAGIGSSFGSSSSTASTPSVSSPTMSTPAKRDYNPWILPGLIRNRPIISPADQLRMGFDIFPFGTYDSVRWEPIPGKNGSEGERTESLLEDLRKALDINQAPEGWDWAQNKTILGIGDSLMRNNVDTFTKHIGNMTIGRQPHQFTDPQGSKWSGSQQMYLIHVPHVNLTVANWFHNGMIEHEVDGFFTNESTPQVFEQKFNNVFLPTLYEEGGLNGRVPDMIIFESLSWDLVLLARLANDAGDTRYAGRPFDDIELDWYRGRMIEVLALLRKTFPRTKIVMQTPHIGIRQPQSAFAPIRKFQQGQMVSSIALETGYDLFDWGRIVSTLDNELTDGLHFSAGVNSWLWGEMLLYYLRRASTHPHNTPPIDFHPPRFTQDELIESYKEPKIQYPADGKMDHRKRAELVDARKRQLNLDAELLSR
ncbi:SGNH hydrolase-type esterase domain [Phaffia rhodozyma]|uniref:SGNH hydrolase-type esterase domain n=1 Tax=Phaffia rhodozyma TaxID=264483 RepID=A0A0F7ST62_PHARH|nr:SGNH hydrolase-type esterase domain [Phaffia rhodozyma]